MGTILASSIIDKAAKQLLDAAGVRWPSPELLGWLNDGQRATVLVKPTAYVKSAAVRLAAGTKQSLPADGAQLLDVVRNMGTDGLVPGRAVRIASRDMLDAQAPNWHAATASSVVRHYLYDPRDPKRFYVYPPNTGTGYVELVHAATPPDVAAVGNPIELDDAYETVLLDYVLYRAFSKDSEAADDGKAQRHMTAWITALGGKVQAEGSSNPNRHAPASPGGARGTR